MRSIASNKWVSQFLCFIDVVSDEFEEGRKGTENVLRHLPTTGFQLKFRRDRKKLMRNAKQQFIITKFYNMNPTQNRI